MGIFIVQFSGPHVERRYNTLLAQSYHRVRIFDETICLLARLHGLVCPQLRPKSMFFIFLPALPHPYQANMPCRCEK
jgi:hypothetical protein